MFTNSLFHYENLLYYFIKSSNPVKSISYFFLMQALYQTLIINSFTLYYYDENSIRIEFFSKEKDNYAFYPQITGIAFEISNILSVTLKDTRKIYIQSEIQEELDFAIKFYEGLKEFSKNHIIIKYTENLIRESSFLSELSQECLKKLSYLHALYNCYYLQILYLRF